MMPATILPLTVGMFAIATIPASAQSVIVVEEGYGYGYDGTAVRKSPNNNAAPFVFGSPIPTPAPVNPYTGLTPSHTYSSPNNTYYDSYPSRGRVENSTLVNPVLVNPRIKDSTLINPVIVDEPRYRVPVERYPRFRRSVRVGGF